MAKQKQAGLALRVYGCFRVRSFGMQLFGEGQRLIHFKNTATATRVRYSLNRKVTKHACCIHSGLFIASMSQKMHRAGPRLCVHEESHVPVNHFTLAPLHCSLTVVARRLWMRATWFQKVAKAANLLCAIQMMHTKPYALSPPLYSLSRSGLRNTKKNP